VLPGVGEQDPLWLHGDVAFVSEEDLANPEMVEAWRDRVPVVALTRARRGATIWASGRLQEIPSFETEEVDPTGAGDVFATAFLVRFSETRDVEVAGRFAAAAAALSVRREGTAGIATREEIEALVASAEAVAG
jgi:sugar/nucleoside kinase (ribokinase family)